MTKQTINVGALPNDATGDPMRSAFQKTNANFNELYQHMPAVGEIRYFTDAPTDPAWLACDGQPHLRTAYPAYEGKRPDDGMVSDILSTPVQFSAIAKVGSVYIAANINSRNIYRSTDLSTWEVITNALPLAIYGPQFVVGGTKVLAYSGVDFTAAFSSDAGLTWTASTIPTNPASSRLSRFYWSATSGFVCAQQNTANFLRSFDLITWQTIDAGKTGYWQFFASGSHGNDDFVAFSVDHPGITFDCYDGSVYSFAYVSPAVDVGVSMWKTAITINSPTFAEFSFGPANNTGFRFGEDYYGSSFTYANNPPGLPIPSYIGGKIVIGFWGGASLDKMTVVSPETFESEIYTVNSCEILSGCCWDQNSAIWTANAMKLLRITLDPLKFNAPGLSKKAGAAPYVYTGA